MKIAAKLMLATIFMLQASAGFAGEPNALSMAEIGDGWIRLFDGETTFGWKTFGKAEWDVEDGAISSPGGARGTILSTTEFADFVLKLDFRLGLNASSAIGFREDATGNGPLLPLGKVVAEKRPGLFKFGMWQTAVITAKDERVSAKVDGEEVFDAEIENYRRGIISLAADPTGKKVEFRSIFLKPLKLESIFNGENLDGWKVLPGHKSVYGVTEDGELNVKNGGGDIQTTSVWGDFCLQLDIIANGDGLNSGVFFRCVPGKFWAGYESQIKNAWKNHDRTKPVDYGTGGIYNRQPARKVVSTDRQWFKKTIIATKKRIAVWVDGYQTADWTDTRKPNDNPRNGCRTKPGAISLQGHDPTTDLSFRDIRVCEYPKQPEPKDE